MEGFENFVQRLKSNSYDMGAEEEKHRKKEEERKKKKETAFAKFGLSQILLKQIKRCGFFNPTPIQHSSIPIIIQGRDVIAMARTGSGKTVSYLFPLFERLNYKHSSIVGARAIIIVPTRELVLQVNKVIYDFIGKTSDLKTCMLFGGKSIEGQFERLSANPDIIIATPGRLLHIILETGLSLKRVEYVVFDEADRLFEMGLSEQLYQIIGKLPTTRQTLLFSATLPSAVAEFSKAGLTSPELIRLDSDVKVSDNIRLSGVFVRSNEKVAALIYLLNNVISHRESTIIFIPTRHHAEYFLTLFTHYKIEATVVYGSMDQQARIDNLDRFRNGEANVLLVTDVAARGIDVPDVNNVINFNFPGKPKLFVHRVGRVGRAGKVGTAYSLIAPDEVPFFLDLELFLGRKSKNVVMETIYEDEESRQIPADLSGRNWREFIDGYIGIIPQSILDREIEHLTHLEKIDGGLLNEKEVCDRALSLYNRTRGDPSGASIARSKELHTLSIHPMVKVLEVITDEEEEQHDIITQMKDYRPGQTIFEYKEKEKSAEAEIMKKRRQYLKQAQVLKQVRDYTIQSGVDNDVGATSTATVVKPTKLTLAERLLSEDSKQERFTKLTNSTIAPKKPKKEFKDANFFMEYTKEDQAQVDPSEDHYALNGATAKKKQLTSVISSEFNEIPQTMINDAVMDIGGETREELNKQRKKQGMIWDRKKGKYVVGTMGVDGKVRRDDNKKKDALKVTDAYAKWKKKTHGRIQGIGEMEERQDFVKSSSSSGNGDDDYNNMGFGYENYNDDNGEEITLTNNKKRKKAPWEEEQQGSKKRKSSIKEGKRGKDEVKSEAQLAKIRNDKKKQQQHTKVKSMMKKHGAASVLGSLQKKGMMKALEKRNALPNRNSKAQVRLFKKRR